MKPINEMTTLELNALRKLLIVIQYENTLTSIYDDVKRTEKGEKATKRIEAIDELILNQTYY